MNEQLKNDLKEVERLFEGLKEHIVADKYGDVRPGCVKVLKGMTDVYMGTIKALESVKTPYDEHEVRRFITIDLSLAHGLCHTLTTLYSEGEVDNSFSFDPIAFRAKLYMTSVLMPHTFIAQGNDNSIWWRGDAAYDWDSNTTDKLVKFITRRISLLEAMLESHKRLSSEYSATMFRRTATTIDNLRSLSLKGPMEDSAFKLYYAYEQFHIMILTNNMQALIATMCLTDFLDNVPEYLNKHIGTEKGNCIAKELSGSKRCITELFGRALHELESLNELENTIEFITSKLKEYALGENS